MYYTIQQFSYKNSHIILLCVLKTFLFQFKLCIIIIFYLKEKTTVRLIERLSFFTNDKIHISGTHHRYITMSLAFYRLINNCQNCRQYIPNIAIRSRFPFSFFSSSFLLSSIWTHVFAPLVDHDQITVNLCICIYVFLDK
jgi:hypothetical protein